jgi:hypothetical protein
MAATAAIRLMTATPQASGGANPASPVIRATAEPTNPKQPLINRIQAVIVARGLKILGMFHFFSYFPGLCLMLIALIQLVNPVVRNTTEREDVRRCRAPFFLT